MSSCGIPGRPTSATSRGQPGRRLRCSTPRRSSRLRVRGSAIHTQALSEASSVKACASCGRAGRSRWRPIYCRVNPSTFVVLAVGSEAKIDSRGYDAAVARAVERFAQLEVD